jgi:uncharacterized protein (UPF0332 family)
MTPADEIVLDEPAKKRERPRPRRGKWPTPPSGGRSDDAAALAIPAAPTKKPQPAKRRPNPSAVLWAKAEAAARSARLLGEAGDWDGAANRAYYAVFSAARAALASVRASLAESKGHSTIVRRIEKHIVSGRGLDPALGRPLIGRLSHARWLADYSDTGADEAMARAMLADAERFLAAVQPFLKKAKA